MAMSKPPDSHGVVYWENRLSFCTLVQTSDMCCAPYSTIRLQADVTTLVYCCSFVCLPDH